MGFFNRGARPERGWGREVEGRREEDERVSEQAGSFEPVFDEPTPEPELTAQPTPEPAAEPTPEPKLTAQPTSKPETVGESVPAPAAGSTTTPEATPRRAPVDRVPEANEEIRITAREALAPTRQHPGPAADETEPPGPRAEVISFANQKGGVAKTTTTLNLAVAFAESGHRVLCVDLDPQGNLTMSQGIDPDKVEASMFDVLVHHNPIREVIHEREVDIAVASIDLAGAEIAMSTQIGRERSLEKALSAVIADYDFVCIDTPPSLGLLTVNALTASDKVIVPVQCEYLSMRGLLQLQNTLDMIRENLNPRVRIEGILPTMLDSRTVHAKEAVEILEENFGELVFKSRIRKAIKFAEAPVRGSSVLKYDPKGNAADYYRELAKEVLTNGTS
jgi:chromosome partitioning protein